MDAARYDVAVVGGGLVGLAAALALSATGLRLALVAREPPFETESPGGWDSRVYAVSPGSALLLDEVGAWSALQQERIAPVLAMRIFGDDGEACIEFDAYDAGLRELAHIVENRALLVQLWQRVAAANIALYRVGGCRALAAGSDDVTLTLEDGVAINARLVVAADGAKSWVRDQAGIFARVTDYRQDAVVANFSCERSHQGVAFQWFRGDGVLALLPLPGNRASMVWSTGNEHAQSLLAADAGTLAALVSEASSGALGALTVITAPRAFPLRLQRVDRFIARRVALVGDAAHNVHPLAGQGLNLGLRDVRELARALATRAARYDCGDRPVLRQYERARREDVMAMQFTTDGLHRLFGADARWLAKARNSGLRMVDRVPQLKNFLVRQAAA